MCGVEGGPAKATHLDRGHGVLDRRLLFLEATQHPEVDAVRAQPLQLARDLLPSTGSRTRCVNTRDETPALTELDWHVQSCGVSEGGTDVAESWKQTGHVSEQERWVAGLQGGFRVQCTKHLAVSRSVWCTNLPSMSIGPHLVMTVGLCAMPAIVSPAHDGSKFVRICLSRDPMAQPLCRFAHRQRRTLDRCQGRAFALEHLTPPCRCWDIGLQSCE